MATTFPLSTYPLLASATEGRSIQRITREEMDDGSLDIDVISSARRQEFTLVFKPMRYDSAQGFLDYLESNVVTEFDLVSSSIFGGTIRGVISSEIRYEYATGNQVQISFDFRGERVA